MNNSTSTLSLFGCLTFALAVFPQTLCAENLVHVVKRGQTVGGLAFHYRVSLDSVLRENPAIDPDRLAVGQRLEIPLPGLKAAGGEYVYVVRAKDTLSRIASYFGTNAGEIAAYNGIANPDRLKAGSTIRFRIPGGPSSPSPKRPVAAQPSAPAPKPANFQYTGPAIYNVGTGETLETIAAATGLSVSDLKAHNPTVASLAPGQTISTGTVLRVPYQPLQLTN